MFDFSKEAHRHWADPKYRAKRARYWTPERRKEHGEKMREANRLRRIEQEKETAEPDPI